LDRSPRPPEKGINWLGVASLVIGLFSLTFTWIPLIGCSAIPLAILGLILGLVGILTARAGRTGLGFPVAGVVASLLAILVPIAVTFGTISGPAFLGHSPWTIRAGACAIVDLIP